VPYTKEELEEWVKGFNVSDDKKKVLLETLADPEVLSEVGKGVLRQSDYSRKMDALTEERQELQAKQTAVLELEDQLVKWREENNPVLATALSERDRMKGELEKLTNAYINKGGSLSELGTMDTDSKSKEPEKPAFDESKYVPRSEYEDALKKTVPALAQWTAEAMEIDREHFALTGQHPDMRKVLAEVYKGKDARAAWEETHGIAAIRQQKNEEAVLARIAAAEKDVETRIRTEIALDPSARRDQPSKGFQDALAEAAGDDGNALAAADQASRARAMAALEGFDPRS